MFFRFLSRQFSTIAHRPQPQQSMKDPAKLSLLTWNIWFDELEQNIRYDSILSICMKLEPDVICFQEVIPSFIRKIKSSVFYTTNYSCSDTNLDGRTVGSYGVMTLCKRNLNAIYTFYNFPTIYGRKLLTAEVRCGAESFVVGNVHLESMSNHPTREKQLEICNNILKNYKSSALCGDFNFCSFGNYSGRGPLENESLLRIMPDFTDMWVSKSTPADPGYTFDSHENRMIGDRDERMRYDRVCHRLLAEAPEGAEDFGQPSPSHFTAGHIQRIGNCPITTGSAGHSVDVSADGDSVVAGADVDNARAEASKYDSPPSKGGNRPVTVMARGCRLPVSLFPSDHFGLYCEFALTQK